MGTVNIVLANGQLGGQLATNDGVIGGIITGVADAEYTLGEVVLVTSLPGAVQAGFSEADDPFIYKFVRDFFAAAGEGTQLYLKPVSNALSLSQIVDPENNHMSSFFTDAPDVSVVGVLVDDDAVWDGDQTVSGMNTDVYTAIDYLQQVLAAYATAQRPMRGVLGGTSFTGNASALDPLTDYALNRVAVLLGDTVSGNGCMMGALLGRIARVPVQEKVSRVKRGAISQTGYYGTDLVKTRPNDAAVIAGKGYITLKQYVGRSGFYFTGDPTATATTDDYSMLARGRVIDKAQKLGYDLLVDEIDEQVPVSGGKLELGYVKNLETAVERRLGDAMVPNNATGITCYIDPDQDIVANSVLDMAISIDVYGYSTTINVKLGLKAG